MENLMQLKFKCVFPLILAKYFFQSCSNYFRFSLFVKLKKFFFHKCFNYFLQEDGGEESESDYDYEAEISDMKRKKKSKSEKR